ncbi:MAG TPA: ATP-binding protein [Kofleriaceae bacterium]|jgi:two-component system sensor histidine kinase PilS (NtrC family)|nr:ATP-binding protein [Kofleriaceae bacterium]
MSATEPPGPADSLPGLTGSAPPAGGELGRRLTWLMLLRTVVTSVILGLTLWLGTLDEQQGTTAPAFLFLIGIVTVTYVLTIVYALLLRRGVDPARLVWPQLAGDLAITSALVYVTGGARSAYTFFFALSVVGAGSVRYRRGAVIVSVASIALVIAVALAAWARALPLPTVPQIAPWDQPVAALARDLGLNVGALVGVGVLSYIFGGELQRTSASLASQRQVAADLYALNRDIVRSLSSGLLTVDLDGALLTINQTAADLLDVVPDQATGRTADAVMPGIGARLRALGPRDSLRRVDLVLPARGSRGARVLGISVSPLRDPADEVIGRIVNFQDLTDLRTLEETARRAERLATVGHLAAGIAHEIRNPLASISGSIELLANTPQASPDDRALMAIVVREIERLDRLINELLEYASPRPREAVEFDLATLVAEAVQVMRQDRTWGAIEWTTELPAGPIVITADPAKLRQVVWNLCRNGAEAAAGGGGHVTVRARVTGAVVAVEIEDDGPGIAPEHVARIFDPFFTTKQKGTGLGLATCHAIVAEHGGALTVASEVGRGTRFTATLPRQAAIGPGDATAGRGEVASGA